MPARMKAAAGPVCSTRMPATDAPAAVPTETAVASQAKASVTVPCGATRSTIAYTLAHVGAMAEPATKSRAARAMTLPVATISARWPAARKASTSARPAAVWAPPPRRVVTMPPASEPRPHTPISGPASASWAAGTATSTAPKSIPAAVITLTSVRIPGARSEPPAGRSRFGAGRQLRDAGCAAKATVPSRITAPEAASAPPVDHRAPTAKASGGPKTQVSSTAVASTA